MTTDTTPARCEFCWDRDATRDLVDPDFGRHYAACMYCAGDRGDVKAAQLVAEATAALFRRYGLL